MTEIETPAGSTRFAIDFDQLRQALSNESVEGPRERYHLDWPGKREARRLANAPATGSPSPVREQGASPATIGHLFIEGDSLDALKLLRDSCLGKIDLVYIDPPYNTGAELVYADNFRLAETEYRRRVARKIVDVDVDEDEDEDVDEDEDEDVDVDVDAASPPDTGFEASSAGGRLHAVWLSMMYARLLLARDLLAEDGTIVVHIDENEQANLEKLLAEVFGEHNRLGTIVWDKRNPKGDAGGIAQQHEYVCLYSRDRARFGRRRSLKRPKANAQAMLRKAAQLVAREGSVNERVRSDYREWLRQQVFSAGEKAYNRIDEAGDVWRPVSMAWPNRKRPGDEHFVPLVHPLTARPCPVPTRGWRNTPVTMRALLASGRIVFGEDESTQPQRKYLLRENLFERIPSLLYFGGNDDALLASLGVAFDHPKPVALVKGLIQSLTAGDDLVLDFFAGSASTAHAVLQANAEDGGNRRFIMVQQSESCAPGSAAQEAGFDSIAQIGLTRIERAGEQVLTGPCDPGWRRDVGFEVLRIVEPVSRVALPGTR